MYAHLSTLVVSFFRVFRRVEFDVISSGDTYWERRRNTASPHRGLEGGKAFSWNQTCLWCRDITSSTHGICYRILFLRVPFRGCIGKNFTAIRSFHILSSTKLLNCTTAFYFMCSNVYLRLVTKFQNWIFQVRPRTASVILLTGRVWDGIMDPLVGFFTSRTRTRWGQLRPWSVLYTCKFMLNGFKGLDFLHCRLP